MRATSRSTASSSLTDGRSPASSQQRLRRLRQHPALREQRRRRVHVSAHDEASTAFESVYDALGVQPTPGVVILAPVHGYRGLCITAEAVRAGQALVSVPWEHALTVEEGQEALHWDMRLAQQLLDAVRQPGSAWHAYAPLLPRRVPSACLWPDAALAELQDDDAATAAARIREHFHEQMQLAAVLPHRRFPGIQPSFLETRWWTGAARVARGRACSRGAVLWALSMVHSRSFLLTADASGCVAAGTRALVPMADQFNHAPPTEQQQQRQQQQGGDGQRTPWEVTRRADGGAAFTIAASRDLGRGEEATISYGHDSNAELLVSYGFVPPRSRTDAVALYEGPQELIDDDRWVPRCSIKSRRLKESLLYDTMMAAAAGDSCPLGVRAQGSSTQLLPVLRVLHCTDEQMRLLGPRKAVLAPLSASNEASVLRHVINRCEELLDDFPTSQADDEKLMRELHVSGRCDYRLELALTYRMERKQTLHEAVTHHVMALEALGPVDS